MALLAVLCALAVPLAGAAKDDTTLISRQSDADGGAGGDASSSSSTISDDAALVAFESNAENLSAEDIAGESDVFVRDVAAGTTTLVSRASNIDGDAPGNHSSYQPEISGDGSSVAFTTNATNLGPSTDSNGDTADIYVRRLSSTPTLRSTTLVSVRDQSLVRSNGGSSEPSISDDGSIVVFGSTATNLTNDAVTASTNNIYVRDIQAGTTTLVSRATGANGAVPNNSSYSAAISGDGRWVVFRSVATNLTGDDQDATNDVFLRDLETNTTTLVSRQSDVDGGAAGDGDSGEADISDDGQYVSFNSEADNLVGDDDDTATNRVFVRDVVNGATTLVSRQSDADGGAPSAGNSNGSAISGNGRFIAFGSDSDNLFPGTEDDAATQIFVRDLQTGTTTLATRQSPLDGGAPATSYSEGPDLTPTGRFVVFRSSARNLSSIDADNATDIFLHDLGDPVVPDQTGPVLQVGAKGKQKLGKPVKLTVSSDETADITATGTATPKGKQKHKGHGHGHGHGRASERKGKSLKLGSTSSPVAAGATVTLKLKPSKRTARKLKKAAKAKASIKLTATDEVGNVTKKTLKVKLR